MYIPTIPIYIPYNYVYPKDSLLEQVERENNGIRLTQVQIEDSRSNKDGGGGLVDHCISATYCYCLSVI